MAKLFIENITSFEFYQNARFNDRIDLLENNPLNNTISLTPGNYLPSRMLIPYKDIKNIVVPYVGDGELHVATRYRHCNYKNKNIQFHYLSGGYPKGSFLKYNIEIFVASPELTFLQMANRLDLLELAMLGLEYCGTYSISSLVAEGFIYNIKPLTNRTRLKNYLKYFYKRNPNYRGIRKAIKALDLIIDNSASPQESKFIIKLFGPRHLGAYGVKNLVSNCEIKLSRGAAKILGRYSIKPDLSCLKTKIALEYQSKMFHNNAEQFEIDKVRSAALTYDGWTVFNIVPSQLKNISSFHEIATKVLLSNNQDTRIRTKDFEKKRKDLWMRLAHISNDIWEKHIQLN